MDNIQLQINRLLQLYVQQTDKSIAKQISETINKLKQLQKYQDGNNFGMSDEIIQITEQQTDLKISEQTINDVTSYDPYTDLYIDRYLQRISKALVASKIKITGAYSISANLWGTLKNYQKYGVQWLLNRYIKNIGCILADEPGLGKTVQTIALVNSIFTADNINALIVCPATITVQWVEMFNKFSPETRIILLNKHSSQLIANNSIENMFKCISIGNNSVVICSYDFAGTYYKHLNKMLGQNTLLILDEVHLLKNTETSRFQSCSLLNRKIAIGLTGTPIQNTYTELFSLIYFVNKGQLGTKKDFDQNFTKIIQKGSYKQADIIDVQNAIDKAQTLQSLLKPVILRRYKQNVLKELPEKVEYQVVLGLNSQQEECYLQEIDKFGFQNDFFKIYAGLQRVLIYSSGLVKDNAKLNYLVRKLAEIFEVSDSFLQKTLDLDISALSPEYLQDLEQQEETEEQEEQDEPENNTIVNFDVNSTLSANKAIIFTHSLHFLNILHQILASLSLSHLRMDGSTPMSTRADIVRRFQTQIDPQILISSAKVGGLGLNLTAANHVFLIQPHWNPAVDEQAVERSFRIGQRRRVLIFKVICGGTIEERIVERQVFKKNLAEKILQNAFAERKISAGQMRQLLQYKRPLNQTVISVINDNKEDKIEKGIVFEGIRDRLKKQVK
ncbi:DNA_repair and recombination protein Rhp26p [Hexamita inflata]|uniref:DNA repair and recombination protein Rhp26p n=1 Tax=Hexamita inflata TaxID=28002 RepID=A0AA86Q5J8_9EUKA|nr:DNA repair and recombination protein Rhp26p [Hexamita inflata]